jgi:hypothetical protein
MRRLASKAAREALARRLRRINALQLGARQLPRAAAGNSTLFQRVELRALLASTVNRMEFLTSLKGRGNADGISRCTAPDHVRPSAPASRRATLASKSPEVRARAPRPPRSSGPTGRPAPRPAHPLAGRPRVGESWFTVGDDRRFHGRARRWRLARRDGPGRSRIPSKWGSTAPRARGVVPRVDGDGGIGARTLHPRVDRGGARSSSAFERSKSRSPSSVVGGPHPRDPRICAA